MTTINNNFSPDRVWRLLRMEARLYGKQYLLFMFYSFWGLVIALTFNYWGSGDGGNWSMALGVMPPFVLMMYFMFFVLSMHARLHKGVGLSFCTIPSTAGERMVYMFVIGIFFYISCMVVLQLGFLVEILQSPELLSGSKAWRHDTIGDTVIVNPLFPILQLLTPSLLVLSAFWYGIIRFKNIFLAIIPIIVVGGLLSLSGTIAEGTIAYEVISRRTFVLIFCYAISAGFFIASYFAMKRLQQTT